MSELVKEVGVIKEPGYLYFIDKDGDISRTVSTKGNVKDRPKGNEKVATTGIQKESNYLYFVTKGGDVGRSVMARGRR